MAFNGKSVFSLKVALVSTAILSVAVMLKLSLPSVSDFAVYELPVIYSSLLSWLKPPYLYLVINGIIISIVASSKFQLQLQKGDKPLKQQLPELIIPPATVIVAAKSSATVLPDYIDGAVVGKVWEEEFVKVSDSGNDVDVSSKLVLPLQRGDSMEFLFGKLEKEKPLVPPSVGQNESEGVSGEVGEEDVLLSKTMQSLQRGDSLELLFEKLEKHQHQKPLSSARIRHKKSVKANPEGNKVTGLGVSKSKRHDTLESTWKMITEGRAMPLTRHLKKSDTWNTHLRQDKTNSPVPVPVPVPEKMKKSETFSEDKSKLRQNRQGSGKLKKEPSLSQDELNRRVEAFIKKFNEEMRLQRQQSLNQYQEMINRGAY